MPRFPLPYRRGDYIRLQDGRTGTVIAASPIGDVQAYMSDSHGQPVTVPAGALLGAEILNRRAA
jgi:hypothetical protein